MKLINLLNEMGVVGMEKIRKNFYRLVKRLNLSTEEYKINQKGSIYVIYKNNKPFARIPSSRILNNSFLTKALKSEV